MPGFCIYQGSAYSRVPNIPQLTIYQGSEDAGFTQVSECAGISLHNFWICIIMSEYACIFMNIPAFLWICLTLSEWLLSYIPLLKPSNLKALLFIERVVTCFNEIYSFKEHEMTVLCSCRDFNKILKYLKLVVYCFLFAWRDGFNVSSPKDRINHSPTSFLEFNTRTYSEPCFETRWKKKLYQNWLTAHFNIRNMSSTVERMKELVSFNFLLIFAYFFHFKRVYLSLA